MVDLETIKKEYDKVVEQLADPEIVSDLEKFEYLAKEKAYLEKILEKQKELVETRKQLEENKTILKSGEDEELAALAGAETTILQAKEQSLEKEISKLLKERSSPSGVAAVIIEIRAGTGGEEAALFTGSLYKIYSKYAQKQNWQLKVLDSHPTELGGFKEIIFEIKGNGAYQDLKNEAGVHRVQRIPETEKSGRIHTSTASVAVLPKPKKEEIKIKPGEIKIDVYRASGPGGQNVNKRETAVRITHLPTGMVVASQTERNQLQNRENALAILAARLLEKKEEEAQLKIAGARKTQIGSAKRAEKIRTYNFPQNRVTDHRIKKSWHDIEGIMAGNIDKMIEDLSRAENK